MDGKDLKRLMRKAGCSVKQLARYLDSTETHVRQLLQADADRFYFESESWEKTVRDATGYRYSAEYRAYASR